MIPSVPGGHIGIHGRLPQPMEKPEAHVGVPKAVGSCVDVGGRALKAMLMSMLWYEWSALPPEAMSMSMVHAAAESQVWVCGPYAASALLKQVAWPAIWGHVDVCDLFCCQRPCLGPWSYCRGGCVDVSGLDYH